MHCLPQRLKSMCFERLKSTFFEIFSSLLWSPLATGPPHEFLVWKNSDHSSLIRGSLGYPSGTLRSKKFQTTLILAFEANSALSRENETKIVKITHSVLGASVFECMYWMQFPMITRLVGCIGLRA